MLPFVVGAAAVGAILMGRTKAKTRVEKKLLLGPKSGRTYEVEDFPAAGLIVVRAPGVEGVFLRAAADGAATYGPGATPPGRLVFKHGVGHPQALATMRHDITGKEPQPPKPDTDP